ncbi:MAG TPA: sigma-70 family RNA polymerase sigma factor [Acidimicrobiales bacterium]|nr:sigma-70 family RNA polymerase sigma factor [Acidimicrobiales bacterium]
MGTDADTIAASLVTPEAFGAVFDRHATTVYRYLVRRIGPSDADDLTGEVFRIAFERRASFDMDRADARPWLYGIATNLIARRNRNAVRRDRAVARLGVDDENDLAERVTDTLYAAAVLPDVRAAIEALPDGERDTLVLSAWEGLSYDDIAAALAVPVGTVRSRLNRARGRLRELASVRGELLTHANVFTRQKERLMTTIVGTNTMPTAEVPRMYPRLAYRDEHAALEWLTRVFGFQERREARIGGTTPDDHMLAWLQFGSGLVMIGHSNEDIHHIVSPLEAGGASVMINVDVDDIDAHYANAVSQGATITMELEDAWYGSRRYEASDLEGHRWHFDEPHDRIRARGGNVPDELPPNGYVPVN